MKTLLLACALLATASSLRAQDLAVNASPALGQYAGPSRALSMPKTNLTATATIVAPTLDADYESIEGQATARLNGVVVQIQTLPTSGTVLVSFSMPPQQNMGLLELVDARTGAIIYTGSVLTNDGQVELPVTDTTQPFEVRLATDHDVVIARMAY